MEIIAKEKVEGFSCPVDKRYELFKLVSMEDALSKTVSVKQSIGTVSIKQLEDQKASYQTRIDEVDEKIAAINLIRVVAKE